MGARPKHPSKSPSLYSPPLPPSGNNLLYDKIGNLVKDSAEGIATIDWTVYGKIKSVTHRTGYYRLSGTDTIRPPDLVFNYDAAGNRISKIAKPRTHATTLGDTAWTTTHYLRDAQGNVLSIYKQHDSAVISTAYFTQIEKHLYGSSRLGIDNTQTELLGATFSTDTSKHYAGNKGYELSNHLGNVLATVADRRIPLDTNHNDTIDYYVAYVNSSSDYSPFGAPLDGRTFNNGSYEFGFGGQMHDNDIYGIGNAYTAEYWEYDSRLGRRWNIDPIVKAWESDYASFANDPIFYDDPTGMAPGDPLKANPKEDAKGVAGSTAPNNGKVQEGGGVQGGTAFCAYCGANGENTYGIPDDPNVPQINQPAPLMGGSVSSSQILGDVNTTGGYSGDQFAHDFAYNTPVVGPALESGDKLVAGDYVGSVTDFGYSLIDLFTFGEGTAERKLLEQGTRQVENKVLKAIQKLSPFELTPTHGLIKEAAEYNALKLEIQTAGEVRETIKYVEHNGKKYVVDGHHRLLAAKELGLEAVPVEKVELPYLGYRTAADLMYSEIGY